MFDKISYLKLRLMSVVSLILLLIMLQYLTLEYITLVFSMTAMILMSLIVLCELNLIWHFELNTSEDV